MTKKIDKNDPKDKFNENENTRRGCEFYRDDPFRYRYVINGEYAYSIHHLEYDNVLYFPDDDMYCRHARRNDFFKGYKRELDHHLTWGEDIRERMRQMPLRDRNRLINTMGRAEDQKNVTAQFFIDQGYANILRRSGIGVGLMNRLAKVIEPFLNDEQRKEWGLE